jgi:hypothetical protein
MPILIIPIVWTVSGFVVSRAKGLRIAAVVLCTIQPQPVDALVKGNAPPPKKGPPAEERKRWNLEECQKQAERGADKAEKGARANMVRASVTSKGARYRVLVDAKQVSMVAKEGDEARVLFKVLKLGKRSYDGLFGEGTVVSSRAEHYHTCLHLLSFQHSLQIHDS